MKSTVSAEKKIWEKLKEIPDPELHISLVDLGLIYEVRIEKQSVYIKMTLTTIGCPLVGVIEHEIKSKLKELPSVKEVEVELTFEPPWSMDRMTDEAKLQLGIM